jgi:hypothetical protein
MNSLRVKIALLLVVAIVSVLGVLTLVFFYFLGPPRTAHTVEPVVQQVETLVRAYERAPDAFATAAQRSVGFAHRSFSQQLRSVLAERGLDIAVTVTRDSSHLGTVRRRKCEMLGSGVSRDWSASKSERPSSNSAASLAHTFSSSRNLARVSGSDAWAAIRAQLRAYKRHSLGLPGITSFRVERKSFRLSHRCQFLLYACGEITCTLSIVVTSAFCRETEPPRGMNIYREFAEKRY